VEAAHRPQRQPNKRLIEAVARVFGVPAAFFFDDDQSEKLQDQVELLALLRDSGVDRAQLRAFAALTPDGRQAIADLIAATARADRNRQHAPATGSNP